MSRNCKAHFKNLVVNAARFSNCLFFFGHCALKRWHISRDESKPLALFYHVNSINKFIFSTGDEYNGGWINDKKHGHGVMKYQDGSEYVVWRHYFLRSP